MRARAAELQARAPALRVALLPYVSRLGIAVNARLIATRIKRIVGAGPVVFHCRGESAVAWAVALKRYWPRSGIVADIRGAWPEELLFARGFDGPEGADAGSLRAFHLNFARLHTALAHAGAVLTVSDGMVEWLAEAGVSRDRVVRVPCCVPGVAFSVDRRTRARARLGVEEKLVIAYVGTITRYQHIEDGVIPFFHHVRRLRQDAHLLTITNEPDRMRQLLSDSDVPPEVVTVMNVPHPEVPEYLMAADGALLLRAPSRMNRVSMPVKLAEYLSCGVPVVVSRVRGWVSDIVADHDAGVVLDWFDVPPERAECEAERACRLLTGRGTEMRQAALSLCEREFVWSRYVEPVRQAYVRSLHE